MRMTPHPNRVPPPPQDRNNKAGWDLASQLMTKRDGFNRGRLTVSQALQHRYLSE